jgi:hypothetical protein
MKKIIVLKGVSKSGKSTTINKLYKELSGIESKRKEVIKSFEYKDKKIAIISIGDLLELIERYFKQIGDFDILICACRSKWATPEFYEAKRNSDCDVEFIPKEKGKYGDDEIVKQIKNKIDEWINKNP